MSEIDDAYFRSAAQAEAEDEQRRWYELTGEMPPIQANERMAKFQEGLVKGAKAPAQAVAQEKEIGTQIGGALALPLTVPFNAVLQAMQDSDVISPRTRSEIEKSMVAITPLLMGGAGKMPKPSEVATGAKMALEGKPAGKLRIAKDAPIEGPTPEMGTPPPEPVTPTPALGEVRINLERVDASQAVKETMAGVNAMTAERQAGARARQGHAKTIAEAEQSKLTLEQALALPEEPLLDKGDQLRLRDFHNDAATYLDETRRLAKAGDQSARERLWQAFAVATELSIRDEGVGRAYGRGLESRKILSEAGRAPFSPDAILETADKLRDFAGGDPDLLIQALDNLKTKDQRSAFFSGVRNASRLGLDLFDTVYTASLLSGPKPHVGNFLQNLFQAAYSVPERYIAAMMPGGEVGFSEANAYLYGTLTGWENALRLASRSWKWQDPMGKLDAPPTPPSVRMGLGDNTFARAIDLIATPFRALQTVDGAFKGIAGNAELSALAVREARSLGSKPGTIDFWNAVEKLRSRPTEKMLQSVKDWQLIQTLQDPMGPIGQKLAGIKKDVPVVGTIIAPFVHVLNRSAVWAAQRTPGLNVPSMLFGQMAGDIAQGGAARQLALAKFTGGLLTSAVVAKYAADGLITGQGPRNKELRDRWLKAGNIPYGMKLPGMDRPIDYRRALGPIGQIIGVIADASSLMAHLPDAHALEVAAAVGIATGSFITNQTFAGNIGELLDAISDPERSFKNFINRVGGSFVPGAVREAEHYIDPVVRDAQNFVEAFYQNVPGLSEKVAPRIGLDGKPELHPETWPVNIVSPLTIGREANDPVWKEMDRLKIAVGKPSRVIYGSIPPQLQMEDPRQSVGVQLNDDEYEYLCRLAGNDLKVNGKGAWDTMTDMITKGADGYGEQSDGPDGGKAAMLVQTVRKYQKAAENYLLSQNPPLQKAVEKRIEERKRALMPQTMTRAIAPGTFTGTPVIGR